MEVQTVFKEVQITKASPDGMLSFVASDESVDGHGDIVRASGWDLRRYKKNPIVLFGHDGKLPVGYSPKTMVEGTQLVSDIKLADFGTSEFIDTLRKLIDQKIVRAVSVGFAVTQEPQILRDKQDQFSGFEFIGQELLEISIVSIPSNPNALSLAKSWGTSDRTMHRLFSQDAIVQAAARERRLKILQLGGTSSK